MYILILCVLELKLCTYVLINRKYVFLIQFQENIYDSRFTSSFVIFVNGPYNQMHIFGNNLAL